MALGGMEAQEGFRDPGFGKALERTGFPERRRLVPRTGTPREGPATSQPCSNWRWDAALNLLVRGQGNPTLWKGSVADTITDQLTQSRYNPARTVLATSLSQWAALWAAGVDEWERPATA